MQEQPRGRGDVPPPKLTLVSTFVGSDDPPVAIRWRPRIFAVSQASSFPIRHSALVGVRGADLESRHESYQIGAGTKH